MNYSALQTMQLMSNNNMPVTVYLFAALMPEAKPVIAYLNLKQDPKSKVFSVYRGDNICLTVTGLGKSAMAAGIAYTLASFLPDNSPVLLNFGIAGHAHLSIGSVFVAEKIQDADSGKRFYPQLVADLPCRGLPISSVSKVSEHYPEDCLSDMEASAFFEIAVRFTSAELIQCLKVISDNQENPSDSVNPKLAQTLIKQNVETLQQLINALLSLRQQLDDQEPQAFQQLVQTTHFSVSEQNRLKKLLIRWEALTDSQPLELQRSEFTSGKAFLKALEERIEQCNMQL